MQAQVDAISPILVELKLEVPWAEVNESLEAAYRNLQRTAKVLGGQYTLWHEDTLGELEMRIYFAQASTDSLAARAAQGWGGDRLYAFRSATGQMAVVWLSTWDTSRDADEAQAAAEQVLVSAPAGSVVERSGTALLIARGIPTELQASVRAQFTSWANARDAVPSLAD